MRSPDQHPARGGPAPGPSAAPAGLAPLAALAGAKVLASATVFAIAMLAAPVRVLAASPTPEAAGDPRSAGEGPGLVGDPLMAIVVVAIIGVLTLAATLAWIRATGGPGRTTS